MKAKNILNGTFVLVLILAFIALPSQVVAVDDEQVQPSIKILKVKTLNNEKELQTEFDLWHSVLFGIKYEITGDQDTRYKVKGFVKAQGKILAVTQKRYPGVHRMVTALLVPGHCRPGERTIKYMVKLKKGGELLDKDTAPSEVTILSPNLNLGYLRLFQKDPADWSVVEGGARGLLRYTSTGLMFTFHFDGHDLIPYTSYTLVYYPDPWPGDGLICLASDTTNYHGDLRNLVGAVKIKGDLPVEGDENYPDGAKIWLVRSEDVDCNGKMMVDWEPEAYLFEENLITYENTWENAGGDDAIEVEKAVGAAIRIRPRKLNLKSRGKWMTCIINPPEGYSIQDIDLNAFLGFGKWIAAFKVKARRNVLVAKFDRSDVQSFIEDMGLEYPAQVELKVTGKLIDGTPFEGSDTIKVIKKKRK
jgi:hypothetical protein